MATIRIRVTGAPAAVKHALTWLRSHGANVTGETRPYRNRRGEGVRVYAVVTTPDDTTPPDAAPPAITAADARRKADAYAAAGDRLNAAYWYGYAAACEGLE